ELEGRDTLEEALIIGDEVLIGQTVLEKLDLLVDCQNRKVLPNPAHPDQPVSKIKQVRVMLDAPM
ncbi:MAG: clan AA aspartic protease, partial [Gammaproteobacteria bacterium]|nr:clan AA aspartic protease [Gammaproteobacteria bacterium]